MESTEKRIPAWAVKAAESAVGSSRGIRWPDGHPFSCCECGDSPSSDDIARLLVATREKALREAMLLPVALMDMTTTEGKWHAQGVGDKTKAILSLIDKEPES